MRVADERWARQVLDWEPPDRLGEGIVEGGNGDVRPRTEGR